MTPDAARRRGSQVLLRLVMAGIGVAVAAWLVWTAAAVHLERACVLLDTPYLPLCTEAESKAERQSKLRARLASAPGDSAAWIQLTNLETGALEKPLLRAAATLAPNEPNVLMWRAGAALAANDLDEATKVLVQLVEYRGSGEAADALAVIVASGQGTALLRPYLATASRWLPRVLASMSQRKLPLTTALPLLAEASAKAALPQQTIRAYIRSLKTAGHWADAYGLWSAQQKGPSPLLHNGSFDQPFQADGFDWELTATLPSRAGALVAQRGAANRGQVLDIEFTGRPVALPIIRQHVFAGPGKYQLRGRYMSSRLRAEEGLAWVVRCTDGRRADAVAGQSAGLKDTAGKWETFQFGFSVPPDCGLVVSLQLETFAASEAAAGFKGRASFDALELIPQGV
jgi:hypothetical protein